MLREGVLKELCKEHNTTLYCLSKETGISKSYIYNLANGKMLNPSKLYMGQIARFFGVHERELRDWRKNK